jgi:16S rRNA (cytosine967-C5)-methyltransferase
MNPENFRPARQVGLTVLDLFQTRPDDAAGILRQHIDKTPERSPLTDIVFGVIRNRTCIDNVIFRVGGVPIAHISRKLINILRMGVYELVYCPDREVYAIVSETMKLTGKMGEKQKGFVNAILRKTSRLIVERSVQLSGSSLRMTIPVAMDKGCRLSVEVLSDPQDHPAAYLSTAFSLPQWLVEEWIAGFGFASAMQVCFGSNRRPSVYVRANVLRTNQAELLKLFRSEEIECEAVMDSDTAIQVKGGRAIEKLPGYEQGLFAVQDITAAKAAAMLAPQAGWKVLDMCAAPGGKTIQMAEMMGDEGEIVATDIDAARLDRVRENAKRMGLSSIRVVSFDEAQKCGPYDATLVDVPCSNTGVMARRCEVRYRMTAKQVAALALTQEGILGRAAELVKAGGRMCYSTCSVCSQENDQVVGGFLKANEGWELAGEKLILPAAARFDHDGGYVAVLKKVASSK